MENDVDHPMFDRILRDHRIIELSEHGCGQVHSRMDRDTSDHGQSLHHQERDPCHNEESIKAWIKHGRYCFWENIITLLSLDDETSVGGHALGDFVRVAFGHIMLDQYWAKYRLELESGEKTSDDVVKLAFDEFCRKGYDSARLRHR